MQNPDEPGRETLSAFLDGELAPEEMARTAGLIEQRPDLKEFVARQDRLRTGLRNAFADVMAAPVPERLKGAALNAPISRRWHLQRFIGERRDTLRWAVPAAAALTFGLLIGVDMGRLAAPSEDLVASQTGTLVAQARLADALTRKLASDPAGGVVHVGISFRSKDGTTCRTFEIEAPSTATGGLACMTGGEWQVGALATFPRETLGTPDYRPAGSAMPDLVRGAVSARIDGVPFDAAAERHARAHGWK